MSSAFDIAVLGATPAGYVAALTLARAGHRVVVVDCPALPCESPLADWVPADTFALSPALKGLRLGATVAAFKEIVFHSAGADAQAAYHARATAGYFIRYEHTLAAMAPAARKAGVEIIILARPPKLELGESAVTLHEVRDDDETPRRFQAALLLIAQGSPAAAMGDLALTSVPAPEGLIACGIDVPLPRRGKPNPDTALHLVAPAKDGRLGMYFFVGDVLHIRALTAQAHAPASIRRLDSVLTAQVGADILGGLIGRLQQGGLLPETLMLCKCRGSIWRPPGGVALELDTHLAKRTLLIGTAGGFASAATGQTLDPSIRSALVAAEVAERALKSRRPQETLADYKSQWRDVLAERIRPPGTSLAMLLAMALTNKAMTGRLAHALLYGESV